MAQDTSHHGAASVPANPAAPRRFASLLALVFLTACYDFRADLTTCTSIGKCVTPCATTADCPATHACSPSTSRCERKVTPTECPWPAFPTPAPCGNDRDLYLSPDGVDTNPGTQERPLRTVEGIALLPGDRLHLAAGLYPRELSFPGDGTASCPISLTGAADGGSVIKPGTSGSVRFAGSFWLVSQLRVEGGGGSSGPVIVSPASAGRMEGVRLRQVDVHLTSSSGSHVLVERCSKCTIEGGSYSSAPGNPVTSAFQVWASEDVLVLGNRVVGELVTAAFLTRSNTVNASVVGNTFSGCAAATFDAPGGTFARNLVSDVSGGTMVIGAERVVHNTFLRLGNGVATRGARVFSGNIVSIAGTAREATQGGGFNLFNTVSPSEDGGAFSTDLIALPKLDPSGLPLTDSPAIDAADPSDAVPPGGGARADIGAFERGSERLPDGRYCLPPDAGW